MGFRREVEYSYKEDDIEQGCKINLKSYLAPHHCPIFPYFRVGMGIQWTAQNLLSKYQIGSKKNPIMCGISSTNLQNKEVSVQAELKSDPNKLRH